MGNQTSLNFRDFSKPESYFQSWNKNYFLKSTMLFGLIAKNYSSSNGFKAGSI